MTYEYIERSDNVFLIDTHMFGFKQFQSSYIVAGKEVALIDTGVPPSLEIVREAIKKHGFAITDISHIFVTHCEHPDHSGNVGALLQENKKAKVYIHPGGAEYLLDPSIDEAKRKANLPPHMAARFGDMLPVSPSRIQYLGDGDTFDLGEGEKLKVIFAPGHQPSGIVILEEKNRSLFINDLPGSYFVDAEAAWIFTPYRSDVRQAMASLKKISSLSLNNLYLGHFGICNKPKELIQQALSRMQQLLDIGAACVKEGKPQEIEARSKAVRQLEVEKLRKTRDQTLYNYLSQELMPSMSQAFAKYYLETQEKQ